MTGTVTSEPGSAARPADAGGREATSDAGILANLVAARRRLRAVSRRFAELDALRENAARELKDEVEQVLIGLDLLDRHPPSASVARVAARLRQVALSIQSRLTRRR